MDEHGNVARNVVLFVVAALLAAMLLVMIFLGGGCTAEQGALAKQETTAIGAKVQQCVAQALADEIGSIVLAHSIMSTQPIAPQAQPQTILVPVLPGIGTPSTPHESVPTPRNMNTLDGGSL